MSDYTHGDKTEGQKMDHKCCRLTNNKISRENRILITTLKNSSVQILQIGKFTLIHKVCVRDEFGEIRGQIHPEFE